LQGNLPVPGAATLARPRRLRPVANASHATTARKSSAPGQLAGCAVSYRGVYSPLSIPAMPPVSLVGLSWAIDPDRRLAAALTHVPLNGRLVRRRRASNVRVERLKGRFPKGGVSGDSLQPVVARGEPVRLVWPQWQGVGTVSVQQLVSDFPFDVGRRGYAVGSAVLEAVLPPNHGPTSLCPWL
jgi:hypothetical protein